MKKYFYYWLLLLPIGFVFTACDDDDNSLPNVAIQATISGGEFQDGEIYVVQGQELKIDALTLVNHTNKDAALGAVSYYWDQYPIGSTITVPFTLTVDTSDQPVGRHLLEAQMPIYVVDYPLCWGHIAYYVNVVASPEDMPAHGNPEPQVVVGTIQAND